MNQDSINDYRKFRLNSIEEYTHMLEKHGEEFAKFSNWVFNWMESLSPDGQWHRYDVGQAYIKPFIKVACTFMLLSNTLTECWEFNETYTQIRRMKYEEKQTDRSGRTRR